MSRTMLNEQLLPYKFWCNAVDTSTYILNRILIRAILGKTPYELLKGRKPMLDYFRVFESKCFILNTKDYLTKFDPKSYEGVFLGYSQTTVKPSFKKIEFTKARNKPVKFDKESVKPRIVTQYPNVDRKDWNGKMTQKLSMGKNTGHREVRLIWKNTQRINHQNKFVPTAVLTRSGRIPVSTAKQVSKEKVNTIRVNGVNTAGQIAVSTVKGNRVTAVKASAGYVWRPKMTDLNNGSKDNSGSWISKRGNPQQALKYKGMFDSGCFRHMTENKALLTNYQDIDGGFVAFGGSTRGGKITGLKKNVDAGQTEEENMFTQQYIVFLLWSSISSNYKSSDNKAENDTVDDDACKKTVQEPASEYDQALKNVIDKMMDQEKEAIDQSDVVRKEFEAQCNSQLSQEKVPRASSTNSFNTISTTVNNANVFKDVNTASASRNFSPPHDPLMLELEDTAKMQRTGIFSNAYDDDLETNNNPYDDQSVGAEADFNNMEPSTVVSSIPTTRVHSTHPKAQIIGDPKSTVQTRGMTKKNSREHAMISYIQKFSYHLFQREDDDSAALVDGVANGLTNVFPSNIAFGILSATVWVGVELDFLVAEHVAVVFRA
ncbi:ribonuclease H-like domain-containing protein, partial [Tanacetum coccineum]